MSLAALTWAWEQTLRNPTRKLVLLALADRVNKEGVAWPSQKDIGARCELDVRQVQRHLTTLALDGYIAKAGLRHRRIVWRVNFEQLPLVPANVTRHPRRTTNPSPVSGDVRRNPSPVSGGPHDIQGADTRHGRRETSAVVRHGRRVSEYDSPATPESEPKGTVKDEPKEVVHPSILPSQIGDTRTDGRTDGQATRPLDVLALAWLTHHMPSYVGWKDVVAKYGGRAVISAIRDMTELFGAYRSRDGSIAQTSQRLWRTDIKNPRQFLIWHMDRQQATNA